ncbi:hypothetical protein [Anaerosporomusa subterranea]|uniref:hypothetical protein n=1 Tax=Anaerosporomusa subterranea TaxID=1794912 RepID=UPI0012E723A7|nr:hypothetical protein [Anaerosporomusa subterranea]
MGENVDSHEKEILLSWVRWAENKADWLDPLAAKEDELLGKKQHLFEAIGK